MCVRVWLEVGHACEPRHSPSGRALALDWRVWVRGVAGADISPFVEKVVFDFKPNAVFPYPRRGEPSTQLTIDCLTVCLSSLSIGTSLV